MNQKKAKALRKQSKRYAIQFVKDYILDVSIWEVESDKRLLSVVPERMLYFNGTQRFLGLGTQRWFYKQVKKNPEITYEQIIQKIYPNEERGNDGPPSEEGTRPQATL